MIIIGRLDAILGNWKLNDIERSSLLHLSNKLRVNIFLEGGKTKDLWSKGMECYIDILLVVLLIIIYNELIINLEWYFKPEKLVYDQLK